MRGQRRTARAVVPAALRAALALRAAVALAATIGLASAAQAADSSDPAAGPELPPIVVQSTALGGNAIDIAKVPGNIQTLDAADLSRDGPASLSGAMDSQLGSVNINANLDDQFQPDILYRGFEASPVLGTPQGLAVYQNGVRINEAFGDTVNWDLIPDIAIDRVSIVGSNPVYGLNALGGAISVNMKNGFTHAGSELDLSGGSFGNRAVTAEFGTHSDRFGLYAAGKALDQSGWRLFSTDSIRQLYAVASARADGASLDLSFAAADNHLNGQSAAPVQELALNRGLIFTGPQANANRLQFITLNGSLSLTEAWSLQSVAYYRQYRQDVANGNTSNYVSCSGAGAGGAGAPGELCQPDGLTPVTNAAGAILPDITNGGTQTIGANNFEKIHAYGRGLALQTSNSGPIGGHGNQFTAGAAVDQALVDFASGTQVGPLNPDLLVLPTALYVDTPEDSTAGAAFGATPVSLQSSTRDFGVYATDTLDLTTAVALTVSGRFNVARIDLQDQLGTNLTGNNRYSHFNPAVGITDEVQPGLTAYAGLSVNTRTPTASEIECSDPLRPCLLPSSLAGDPPTLRQVIAHGAELGLRGRWRDPGDASATLSWNLGLFRTRLHDDIFGIATSLSQGFFQNIGDTRRQGVEAGLNYRSDRGSAFASYSYVEATFESPLTVPSPSNPFQDANGDIRVTPGDQLPGNPRHRLKIGGDFKPTPPLSVGATLNLASTQFYAGDESNQNRPLPGFHVLKVHATYQIAPRLQAFGSIDNLLNARYATYGILADPTGVGAPGIPADGVTNGPGVDNRFQSPAPPFAVFAGIRLTF